MPRTSPTSECMTTCEHLTLPDFARTGYQLTLWPEARPARTPAAPTPKAAASTGKERASSSSSSASSPSSDPVGLALRTHLGCALEELTGCSMNWRRSATPAGRSWWVLTTLERPTSASGSGSLLPTCIASELKRGVCDRRDRKQGRHLRYHLRTILTPTAKANLGCQSMKKWKGNWSSLSVGGGSHGTKLLARIYGWMMGYPPKWLDDKSKPTATPSCPKSQKPSDAQS